MSYSLTIVVGAAVYLYFQGRLKNLEKEHRLHLLDMLCRAQKFPMNDYPTLKRVQENFPDFPINRYLSEEELESYRRQNTHYFNRELYDTVTELINKRQKM